MAGHVAGGQVTRTAVFLVIGNLLCHQGRRCCIERFKQVASLPGAMRANKLAHPLELGFCSARR